MSDNQPARYTSRKFWTMVVFELLFITMRWKNVLPTEAFVSLTWLTIGGYFLANVGQASILQYLQSKGNPNG